jgi:type IV pilus assembly protein PilM
MLNFLKSKKNRFIGIDFGTSSIKVVELSYKSQKAFLENYGVVNLDAVDFDSKKQSDFKKMTYEQSLGDALKKLIAKMNLKSKATFVAIPGFSGLITIIELPEMQEEELTKAIQFEAHKYIPSSLEEVAMSWEIIEHIDNSSQLTQALGKTGNLKRIRVLLVAAPKKDIEHYDRLVLGAKLKVSAIELETFSLVRSLLGDDNGNFLIIDIGLRATNIILVEKGIVIVNRNVDAGGNEITSAIADSLNVSRQRAESFKKGEKDLLNSKESYVAIPMLEFIANESKRILNAYMAKNKDARIDGIILSGGTSKMKGLEEYFTRALGMKTILGNPWRRITVKDEARVLVPRLGGSFSVALGLALRGIEEYKRK